MDSFAVDIVRGTLCVAVLFLFIVIGWYLVWVFFLQEINAVRVLAHEITTSLMSFLHLAPPKKARKKRQRSTSITSPSAISAFSKATS